VSLSPPELGEAVGGYTITRAHSACSHEGWTDERVALLTKLWGEGLSGSQIAKKLGGLTRSAVIGKVHRLKLPGRERPAAPARVKRPPMSRARQSDAGRAVATTKLRPLQPPAPPVVVTAEHAKPWTERRFGECAYPIAGEGADTVSCCAPTEKTYCKAHSAAMFAPSKANETLKRSADRFAAYMARRAA